MFVLAVRLQMGILGKRKFSEMYGKEMAFQSLLGSCAAALPWPRSYIPCPAPHRGGRLHLSTCCSLEYLG